MHGSQPKSNDIVPKQWAYDAWRKPEGDDGSLWLRDVTKALPEARVFLYEYKSKEVFSDTRARAFLDAANDFLDCLLRDRKGDEVRFQNVPALSVFITDRRQARQRPLILVAHSLGGLLVKQALVNSQLNDHFRDISDSV